VRSFCDDFKTATVDVTSAAGILVPLIEFGLENRWSLINDTEMEI